MKNLLLLVVISSFAVGMVGCKSGDETDTTATTTPSGTAAGTDAGTPPPVPNANKAGAPQASSATASVNPAYANDPRWKPGTMVKGGK